MTQNPKAIKKSLTNLTAYIYKRKKLHSKNTINKKEGQMTTMENKLSKERRKMLITSWKMDKSYEQVGQKRNTNSLHTHIQCSIFFIREM